jgi:hypothetical protein
VAQFVAAGAITGPGPGTVLGSAAGAVYLSVGASVLAVTAARVPLMPNAVSLRRNSVPGAPAGTEATVSSGEVRFGDARIDLRGARQWSPEVPNNATRAPADVSRRGRGVLRAAGIDAAPEPSALARALARPGIGLAVASSDEGESAVASLLDALVARDDDAAAGAARRLLGRGGGLTPEGDDILAGAGAALAAWGRPAGVSDAQGCALRAALAPPDVRARTTALSATLLELAVAGRAAAPLIDVLDLGSDDGSWRAALARLHALGHSTGRAWALGCAAAGVMLGAPAGHAASSLR